METGKSSKVSKGVIGIALSAALFTALNAAIDNYIVHKVIVSADRLTAASFYLIVGSWVYILWVLVCNKIFGKQIDTGYPGFTFGAKRMHKFAALSGILGAISTLFYLLGNQMLDPSLILVLLSFSVVYMAVFDKLKGNIKGKVIIMPASLIISGSALASIRHISGGIKVTMWGIIIFAVVCSGLSALGDGTRKKGVKSADAVTFCFWRFVWLSTLGTVIAVAMALFRGKFYDLIEMRKALTIPAFGWISLTMILASFYNVFSQKALRFEALSVVFLFVNSKIAMGVPITALGNFLFPGVFGEISKEWLVWIVRSIGATLTLFGVVCLRQKTRKATIT